MTWSGGIRANSLRGLLIRRFTTGSRPKLVHPPCAAAAHAEQVGQRPDQRVGAVRREAGSAAVEIGSQRAELVLKLAERPDVKHEPALVSRGDRLGAQEFSARRVDRAHRQVGLALAQHLRHHVAAVG